MEGCIFISELFPTACTYRRVLTWSGSKTDVVQKRTKTLYLHGYKRAMTLV